MSELRTLLTLELRSLYGLNKFRHSKDTREKGRYRGLLFAWVLLIGIVVFYVSGLVYGLCRLGLGSIVPAYLAVLASLLILAFGLFTSGHRIFGQKGYDILASMPVKANSIVLSRFLCLYVEDLLFALVIMLPGTVTYGIFQRPGIGFYGIILVGTLLIPAVPLVVSTLLGTLIMAASARMKRKSLVQTVLMVLLVVGIMVGSISMGSTAENVTLAELSQLAQAMGALIGNVYPPALWLNQAAVHEDLLRLGLFLAVSVAVMALAVFVTARSFHSILRRLQNVTARHDYKIGHLERRSLLKALYLREARRYFSSSVYVTNTIIGPIMGAMMSIALCIAGVDAVHSAFPVPMDIPGLLPFVFSAVFCMMTTTSVSVSMEGKPFWVIKSLPIPPKNLLDSKILLNLTLMLPFWLISAIALIIATKPGALQLLWLLVIPVCIMLFCVVFGITVNLKFHSFDWEKEETVVKQSLPAALGGFAGFFLSALLGVAVFFIPAQFGDLARALICLTLLLSTALLYRKNNRAVLSEL